MRCFIIGFSMICLSACATTGANSTAPSSAAGEQQVQVRTIAIDRVTEVSSEVSDDASYGYTEGNAIKVGGGFRGPLNERTFLSMLAGPNGEKVSYKRLGSCCSFKTLHAMIGDSGALDEYEVVIDGKDTKILFLNMYDPGGTLKIPVGFTMAEDASGDSSRR